MLVGILTYGGEMQLDGVPVPAAKRCLAILVCVSTLWATEAIPMYITSLLVPILVVATQALLPAQDKPGRFESMDPAATAKEICGQFFDPTVLFVYAAGSRDSSVATNGIAANKSGARTC